MLAVLSSRVISLESIEPITFVISTVNAGITTSKSVKVSPSVVFLKSNDIFWTSLALIPLSFPSSSTTRATQLVGSIAVAMLGLSFEPQ